TPSINTVGSPPIETTRITRMNGLKNPAGSRSRLSGDVLLSAKSSWNPLRAPALTVTCTDCSASTTSRGAGIGTTGPMSKVSWMPLIIAGPRHPFGHGDPQDAARALQILGTERVVGVADEPVDLGVA